MLANLIDEQSAKLALGLLPPGHPPTPLHLLPDLALLRSDVLLALSQAGLGPLLLLPRLASRRILVRDRIGRTGGGRVVALDELVEDLLPH